MFGPSFLVDPPLRRATTRAFRWFLRLRSYAVSMEVLAQRSVPISIETDQTTVHLHKPGVSHSDTRDASCSWRLCQWARCRGTDRCTRLVSNSTT